jgi:hypothetical protein
MMMGQDKLDVAQLRLLERDFCRPVGPGGTVGAEHDRRVIQRMVAAYDHNRAAGMSCELGRHRTDQETGEPAKAAMAEDEQLSIA